MVFDGLSEALSCYKRIGVSEDLQKVMCCISHLRVVVARRDSKVRRHIHVVAILRLVNIFAPSEAGISSVGTFSVDILPLPGAISLCRCARVLSSEVVCDCCVELRWNCNHSSVE